jgi:hypothetical protein
MDTASIISFLLGVCAVFGIYELPKAEGIEFGSQYPMVTA